MSEKNIEEAALLPAVDVIEDGTGITLYADLPGVPRENLDIQIDRDTLTLQGGIRIDSPQGMEATHAEIGLPKFRRSFSLSRELDASGITANFEQGVLRLRIPKAEHAKPRKIEVSLA